MTLSPQTQRRKVCVVVTARASYCRIRTALEAIERHPNLELQVVAAASAVLDRYGNAVKCIEADGFTIAAQIYNILEGENTITAAKSTGLALVELATVFSSLQPDVVVTIADRFETLATATAAAYMHIPLAHIQGGEITGSIDEKVRHAVTKLADLHFVASEHACRRVVEMGEDPAKVYITGCPSIDLAARAQEAGPLTPFDCQRIGETSGVGAKVDFSGDYLVVLQHPVTTEYVHAREQVTETLHAIHETGLPTAWFWPNVDAGSDGLSKGIRSFREQYPTKNIRFIKHLDSMDFLRLAFGARCIVGNSSVAIRECSFLGVPAVNIGTRQTGRDRGQNVVDVGYQREEIACAIERQLGKQRFPCGTIYGSGDAGERIAHHLAQAPLSVEKQLMFSDARYFAQRVNRDQASRLCDFTPQPASV